jgi:hypothetical protein
MPKKILNIEDSSTDDNTDNEESEPEVLTNPIKKEKVFDKPKKQLSDKQKAVLESARKKRTENIALAKQNLKIEAAKLLIEQDTNLKLKSTPEPIEQKKKSKKKTIIIESESESSSEEEQIIIKKKRSKSKPKPKYIKEESESEEEEEVKPKEIKQRHMKPQISEKKLNKHNLFDGFC